MCHIGTWSTRYYMRTAEKVWRSKVKKIWFVECQKMTLGKSPFCRVSGEDTWQRVNGGCRPLTAAAICRVFWFAECSARQNHLFAEYRLFTECFLSGTRQIGSLPSVR